jgi:hypothetical protein
MKLESHSIIAGRRVFIGQVDSQHGLAGPIQLPSPNFVVFIAADVRDVESSDLLEAAEKLIRSGASYTCCWGPDCSRFEDCFDHACVNLDQEETYESVIMTTSHAGESLEAALWFAIYNAWPAQKYEETTRAVVIISVGNMEWHEKIQAYVNAGAPDLDDD